MEYKFTCARGNDKYYNYKPEPKHYEFYQICHFKNPTTNKYHVRKLIINELGEYIHTREGKYTDSQFQKFLELKKSNQYRIYPTYDLALIDYPKSNEILELQSDIINTENDYTGYAKF